MLITQLQEAIPEPHYIMSDLAGIPLIFSQCYKPLSKYIYKYFSKILLCEVTQIYSKKSISIIPGWISYFCDPDSLLSTQSCVNNPMVIIGEKVNSNYNMIPLFLLQFLWWVLKKVWKNNLCYFFALNPGCPVINVSLILKGLTDRHCPAPNNRGGGGLKNKGGRGGFWKILYWLPMLKAVKYAWDIPNKTFKWIEIQN